MSTDFIALFDSSPQAAGIESLLQELATNPPAIADVVEKYKDAWATKTWETRVASVTGEPEIIGPGGSSITFKPRTVEMYHMMPFRIFTHDPSLRDSLRRVCLVVASLLGSPRVIYTHELMPYEGDSLDQIEAGLRNGIGPPAGSFEELDQAEYYGPRAWYIERFTDIRKA